MVASTNKLAALHSKLADVLADAMEGMDTDDPIAMQGNVQVMKLVTSFLKDNGITSDMDAGDDENEKIARLEILKSSRRKAPLPTDMLVN